MLKNAYLGAKIGFDTAENEPPEVAAKVSNVGRMGHSPATEMT